MSCDLRETEQPGLHYKGDVRDVLDYGWDLMIGHPYCTFNNLAGICWMYHPEDTPLPAEQRRRHPKYPNRMDDFLTGVEFFKTLMAAPIPLICLENSKPHGLAMRHIGRPTQVVQPWMFGDPYTKGAALWLKGLPPLVPSHGRGDYEEIFDFSARVPPGPDREKIRSRTYPAIAEAMAEQWGAPA